MVFAGESRGSAAGMMGLALLAGCVGALPAEPSAVEAEAAPMSASASASASATGAAATPSAPGTAAIDAAAPARAPLSGSPFVELPIESHRSATISLPLGATAPRPLLVVTHGAGGRPEPHCAFWRGLLGNRGFILCPRGVPLGSFVAPDDQGFFYPDHRALGREVTAAVAALRARFGAYLDDRAPIYAGFSQGATMGALAFVKKPAAFARLVLIEGGVGEAEEWTINGARAFREGGADRVLFACGRPGCFTAARRTITYLDKAGLEGRVVGSPGAGHTYGGPVAAAVEEALPWILAGDPRWGG